MNLPGGFSPVNFVKEAASSVPGSPNRGRDYNVFSEYSVAGGDRDPVGGGLVGRDPTYTPQVQGQNTDQPSQTGGGGDTRPAPVDPYARWGGQAAFNALRGGFTTQQENERGAARQSLTDIGNTYDQKTRDWLNTLEDEQGGINTRSAQNALNLRQSMQNIVRGIQQGIKSGNVALAGMNALSSGAADAIARAYARIGNNQTGEARGEAAEMANLIGLDQTKLNRTRREGEADLNTYRDTETGRVRSDFSSKLNTLRSNAQQQGVGDVVNTGLVDQVIGEAMARLQAIDAQRSQRLGGIQAWTPEQVMQEALRMEQAGQVGEAFSVTGPNVSYGGGQGGVMTNQVPIYLRNRDELETVPTARSRRD